MEYDFKPWLAPISKYISSWNHYFLSGLLFRPGSLEVRSLGLDLAEVFLASLFVWFLYFFLGVFLASIMHTGSTALALGIFFLSYMIGVVSPIKEELGFLQYLSPFDYALAMDIVRKGWEMIYVFVGSVAMILLLVSSFYLYKKKNFRI